MRPIEILVVDLPMRYADVRSTRLDDGKTKRLGAVTHYKETMSIDEMCDVAPLVKAVMADVALGFFWSTCPMIEDYFKVINAWQFRLSTKAFTWVKCNPRKWDTLNAMLRQMLLSYTETRDFIQLLRPFHEEMIPRLMRQVFKGSGGHHTMANTEDVWLAIFKRPGAGSLKKAGLRHLEGRKPQQVVLAPSGRHSAKPEEVQDRIDWMYREDLCKVEFFARRDRPGWLCLGNEGVEHPEDIRVSLKRMADVIERER